MARRKQRPEEAPRELTRKETRLQQQQRERNRKILTWAGVAVGVALLLVVAGVVYEFVVRPNSVTATVGGTQIITRDYWKRTFLEQNRLQNQLVRLSQLEAQFGGQGFFASQINQLQGTLGSPFILGVEVLDQMIREEVIRQKAAERGITVTEAEIEEALREEVAGQRGAVTVPQATATAEAAVEATATAESWTPTPTATVDASGAVTATATPLPTPVPPVTSAIMTDAEYTEGLQELENNLRQIANMTLDEYRKIVEVRLLNDKLLEAIGAEEVTATTEQVHARHILLTITEPVSPTAEITSTDDITVTDELTPTEEISSEEEITSTAETTATEVTETEVITEAVAEVTTEVITETEVVSATEEVTDEVESSEEVTATSELTDTEPLTDTELLTDTESLTDTTALTETVLPTEAETPEPRNEAQALALALELRQRILDGEDFATIAAEYSDDPGSGANGGDLGWFGRGAMVAPFEEAAFSLEVGEISEPIRSDFGYHLIEVLEKDAERPKDEATLESERAQAYNTWLEAQITATSVERPSDLVSMLPRNLNAVLPQQMVVTPTPVPAQ